MCEGKFILRKIRSSSSLNQCIFLLGLSTTARLFALFVYVTLSPFGIGIPAGCVQCLLTLLGNEHSVLHTVGAKVDALKCNSGQYSLLIKHARG